MKENCNSGCSHPFFVASFRHNFVRSLDGTKKVIGVASRSKLRSTKEKEVKVAYSMLNNIQALHNIKEKNMRRKENDEYGYAKR